MTLKQWLKRLFTPKSARATAELNELYKFLGIDPNAGHDTLSEATYYACRKTLAEAIGKMPVKLQQHTQRNGVRTAREHPLYDVVRVRPNPYMTATQFWSTLEDYKNVYGDGFAWIKFDPNPRKTTLWILPSNEVEVWYDDARILADQPDIYYLYTHGGKTYKFGSEEIIHVKVFDTLSGQGSIRGVPVAERLKATMQGSLKSQQMLNRMYETGFTAKAVLQYTGSLSDASVRQFVAGIEDFAKGKYSDAGVRDIIPIPVGSTITPLNIKLADNQFVDVKKYTALQIASAFGIKPNQIGDYTKSSYASAEAQQLSFYVDTLLYIIKQYEEELTYKLLLADEVAAGYHFKFNASVILRTDPEKQIRTLAQGVANFIYTPNEAREKLDLEAKDGGDQLLGNGSSIPIQYVGSQYMDITGEEENNEQTEEPDGGPGEEPDDGEQADA